MPHDRDDYSRKLAVTTFELVKLLYHPGRVTVYTGREDVHGPDQQASLVIGEYTLQLDREILPIVAAVISRGWFTAGSCQQFTNGLAYVQLLHVNDGAERFSAILRDAGVDVTRESELAGVTMDLEQDRKSTGQLVMPTIKVMFPPEQITLAFEAVRQT